MSNTTYRPINGFPGYRVGDDGSVWTCWKKNGRKPAIPGEVWRQMKPAPNGDGYLASNLFRDGVPYRRKVHLLVLEAFVGPRPVGLEGCHSNGTLADCSLANLRWDTHAANIGDRLAHGTDSRGSKNGNAKLNETVVRAIKDGLQSGRSQKSLAVAYGVAPSTVSGIAKGRLWGWIDSGARAAGVVGHGK